MQGCDFLALRALQHNFLDVAGSVAPENSEIVLEFGLGSTTTCNAANENANICIGCMCGGPHGFSNNDVYAAYVLDVLNDAGNSTVIL